METYIILNLKLIENINTETHMTHLIAFCHDKIQFLIGRNGGWKVSGGG